MTYTPGEVFNGLSSACSGLSTKYFSSLDFFTQQVYSMKMQIKSTTITDMAQATPITMPTLTPSLELAEAAAIVVIHRKYYSTNMLNTYIFYIVLINS